MRKKVTKKTTKKAATESSWFNKSVFYSVVVLAICSTATACTLLLKGLDVNDRISSGVDSSPIVVEVAPEVNIEEGSKEPGLAMISATDLIANHLAISHSIDGKEILFKCHNLAGALYSCKIVQGKAPNLKSDEIPTVEIEEPSVEKELDVEEKEWDPFR